MHFLGPVLNRQLSTRPREWQSLVSLKGINPKQILCYSATFLPEVNVSARGRLLLFSILLQDHSSLNSPFPGKKIALGIIWLPLRPLATIIMPPKQARGMASVLLTLSYFLDWLVVVVLAVVGGVLGRITPNKRPFSLGDRDISCVLPASIALEKTGQSDF